MQGIVLTSCTSIDTMLSSIRNNHIPLLKVVTGWGYHWDDASRNEVCATMPEVLVRTVSGDGTSGAPALDPGAVVAELRPWCDARGDIWLELGNEPNAYDPSDDAAWNFQHWFSETATAVRQSFPQARIVTPGLTPDRQTEWWAICQGAFEQADVIGFHAYAHYDFDDTGQLSRARSDLALFYPAQSWLLTECGIHDPNTPPEVKAQRYAALHAKLPPKVIAACFYHYCDDPMDADQAAYALPPEALPYLYAGGTL
jgi:hypothetical protein